MNRIVFLLKEKESPVIKIRFCLQMLMKGIRVSFALVKKDANPDSLISYSLIPEKGLENTLYIVDSPKLFLWLHGKGINSLVYIRSLEEMDEYSSKSLGPDYFVMDVFNSEADYFEKVYRRIHDIPWEVIKTKRLILRETTEEDVDELAVIYKDPSMTQFMEGLYEDIEEEKKYAREYRDKVYAIQGFGIWTVVRKADGKIIGRAGLITRAGFDEPELGYAIGCKYQRQGYATEAIKGIMAFAKEEELGTPQALVMPENLPSIALLKGLGFEKVSETTLDSKPHEVWRYMGCN